MKSRKGQIERLKEQGFLNDDSIAQLRQRLKERLQKDRTAQEEEITALKNEIEEIKLRLGY